MYKRLTLDSLMAIKNNFLPNLKHTYTREKFQYFKESVKSCFKEGDTVYYLSASQPTFRLQLREDKTLLLVDEIEKNELIIDEAGINTLHNLLKDDKKIAKDMKLKKSMMDTLIEEINQGNFDLIDGKPYLVYDIETTFVGNDLKTHTFILGYSVVSNDNKKLNFKYIEATSLEKFVRFMIDFDGYIIGYNNISFDNPVCVYNIPGLDEKNIQILNEKSLDIFVFLRNMTGKRMGLNKVASALVGTGKTLESGLEGEGLYKKYLETGDEKLFTTFKNYCKNDVKITMLVLCYLLKYKKVYIEGEEISFSFEDFLQLARGLKSQLKEVSNEPIANMFEVNN